MLISTYKKKGISISHVWFMEENEELPDIKTDIFFVHGVGPGDFSAPSIISKQNTLIIDLSASEEDILSNMNKKYRNEIKRASNEGITTQVYDSPSIMNNRELVLEFGENFDDVFREKGIKEKFNHGVVQAYAESNMLTITTAAHEDMVIAFHAYIVSEKRARALYSISKFRDSLDSALVGRANKYLNFRDFLYFKNRGVNFYDFGGISSFDEPNGIDKFKLHFGGEKHTYSNVLIGKSSLGKAVVRFKKFTDHS